MVFRILDLFLYEGFSVIFSVALSLLKASQRDLLAHDFEGILKYFRVSMPKKYRSELHFKDLMQIWSSLHSKITDKKLKKYEKNYKLMKEAEALKEDPAIRYERECKRLTGLLRRLEQENDDLANEYIESKITLSKQLEEIRDEYDMTKAELSKFKSDYQNKLNESADTNKKLMSELDQLKQLWRKESDKYESELERSGIIITEYKQICNTLSNKVEKWGQFKKKYEARNKKLRLCEPCEENNRLEDEFTDSEAITNTNSGNDLSGMSKSLSSNSSSTTSTEGFEDFSKPEGIETTTDDVSSNSKDAQAFNKIKRLELELARVKLELVDAQCKNQEFDHKLKGYMSTGSAGRDKSMSLSSNQSMRSNSIVSQTSTENQSIITNSSINSLKTSPNGTSYASTPNNNSNNNWLSKTLTQFKEATNQVVQKAQKVKIPGNETN